MKQNVGKMQADMVKMAEWASAFQDYGQRQAGLDVKYTSDRYHKGCSKVKDFCDRKLKLLVQENFNNAQDEILSFSQHAGCEGRSHLAFLRLQRPSTWNMFFLTKSSG